MVFINKLIKIVGILNKYFLIKLLNKNFKIFVGIIFINICIKFRCCGFECLFFEVEGLGLCWLICKIFKKCFLNI